MLDKSPIMVYNVNMEKRNGQTKVFSARIDEEVLQKVAEKAKDENRSLSNMIETILRRAVEDK